MTPYANNLHAYWDRGAGLFRGTPLSVLVARIQKAYPPRVFKSNLYDDNPFDWVDRGYQLAKDVAYQVQLNSEPNPQYVKMAQEIVKRRIALAGYRLANMLNAIMQPQPEG